MTADPAAPTDPSRIQIDTRLITDFGDGPLVDVPLTLTGTYNQTTGAISVSGGATGTFLNNLGPDPFGLFPGTYLFKFTNPMESLHGVVSVSGTESRSPEPTQSSRPETLATSRSRRPTSSGFPRARSTRMMPSSVSGSMNPTGAIYNWSATSVPEPGSMVLVLSGLAGSFLGWKLRRGRTA